MTETYVPAFSIEIGKEKLLLGKTVDVMSVSVTESCEGADIFSFSMRDRHKESGRFAGGADLRWIDDEDFQEGKKVRIEMGYVGNMRLMIVGRVTAVTPNFPESGMPTLAIRGTSLYDRLMRARRREPFTKSTDSDIAGEIARQVGLKAQVDPTTAEYPYQSATDETLHQFLTRRAQRIGYELVVKEETLYFEQPGYRKNPSPVLVLEWGRNLKSFRPNLRTHGINTEVRLRGTLTSQGGSKTAVVGSARAGDERVKLGRSAGSEFVSKQLSDSPQLYEDHSIRNQEEANEIALAQLERGSMEYLTGSGSCIGNIKLKPRTVIEIKNLGARFSGRYYVTRVRHTIDSGGYRSDFDVKRNAR